MQPLVGAERQHQLAHFRIGSDLFTLDERVDQPGRRHYLETLIDADKELRRDHGALDGAELRAFDLSWDRAELARRIDLTFDATARVFLDRSQEVRSEGIGDIVNGRRRNLQFVGFFLRQRRAERQR